MNAESQSTVELGGLLWGVLVTYRRPSTLGETLDLLARQSRPLDRLVIVDNGSEGAVAAIASKIGATYVDALANTGPAGGIAMGMETVQAHAGTDDWIVLIDDDDPPPHEAVLEDLCSFALSCCAGDVRTAAVGRVGARYDPRLGVFDRIPDEELTGRVLVDYIGGGAFPMYRCGVLREVGTFDPDLFFGFDDAEFGLRLRHAGFGLYVDGDEWKRERQAKGRLNLPQGSLKTSVASTAWRRYYTHRNAIAIAQRYGSPLAPWVVALGGTAKGVYALARSRRPMSEVVLPFRAAFDGLAGRMGRRVDPGSAKKVG